MPFDHSQNGLEAPAEEAPEEVADEVVEDEPDAETQDELEEGAEEAHETQDEDELEPDPDPWTTKVEAWGGEEKIEDAVAIADALGSVEGIEALVREGLQALPANRRALLLGGDAAPEEDAYDPDDDEPITRKEAREMAAKQAGDVQERLQAQQEQVIASRVEASLESLGVADDPDARVTVLNFAQKHVGANEMDPDKLVAAVRAGYEDFQAWTQAAAEKYVAKRAAKNKKVPRPARTGGGPAASEEVPAPANMDDAKAAARKFFKANGLMD